MPHKKLHLGCFDTPLVGWHNTDITPHIFIARIPMLPFFLFRTGLMSAERYEQHKKQVFKNVRYLDVSRRFPFSENIFDYVFTSHMLEHLHPWQSEFCLREIYRVMKPGGIVRVAVPDLDKMIASYNPKSSHKFLNAFFESDQKNPKNQHHWHYNENLLGQLFCDIGFAKKSRCDFQQGDCVDIELLDNRPESLFMEAQK